MNKNTVLIVTLFGIIALVIGLTVWKRPRVDEAASRQQSMLTSREATLLCTTDMATRYHIHPQLRIVIDGNDQVIPANIGIRPECMTSIHTHTADGIIHVESPVAKDFTLGDFFAVWGKPFDQTHILDRTTDTARSIVVTVNGSVVTTYENTVLRDKDTIFISYQSVK